MSHKLSETIPERCCARYRAFHLQLSLKSNSVPPSPPPSKHETLSPTQVVIASSRRHPLTNTPYVPTPSPHLHHHFHHHFRHPHPLTLPIHTYRLRGWAPVNTKFSGILPESWLYSTYLHRQTAGHKRSPYATTPHTREKVASTPNH